MRDPAGNRQRYDDFFEYQDGVEKRRAESDASRSLEAQVKVASMSYDEIQKAVVRRYCAGLALPAVAQLVGERVAVLGQRQAFVRMQGPQFNDAYSISAPIRGGDRRCLGFAALALMLLPSGDAVQRLAALVQLRVDLRSYLFDVLLMAFEPGFALAKKYKADQDQAPWIDPVLRALALPENKRAEALTAHMKHWCRAMRPFGWKPNLDTAVGKDDLFCDFAFEVALAVCAYDIDDSAFNTHPYYPRDLVDYYRANLRQDRDGWRAVGAGAGVAISAPPAPAKADLAKSKRKGIARWVELVCDGDVDATEAVLDVVDKPKKIKDRGPLLEALFDNNQAILADTRDDDTVGIACACLASARRLGDFDAPPGPPFGLFRCTALLRTFSQWLPGRGYHLVDLASGDDGWNAVVVRAEYRQELLELGDQLGLMMCEPADAYHDGRPKDQH